MPCNASYTIFIFESFFICTTNWYAFYMHSYVDKILFLWKVGITQYQVLRWSTLRQISKPGGLTSSERHHRPLQRWDKTTPGGTDSKNLSGEVKPAPLHTDSKNLLECHPPQHQEHSGIDLNTVEASNRPLRTNHLKFGPTGHVNYFADIEIISS
jgi:hypothetical protein